MVNSRRGRPAGGGDARERLVECANRAFLTHGYAGASVRSIARDAGVSHSLVNYYFGGKEGLFGEVMAIGLRPSRLVAAALAAPAGASPQQRAVRLVDMMLTEWDARAGRTPLVDAIRQAVASDELREIVAGFASEEIFGQLVDDLGGRDARSRAAAIASVMSGAIFTRYILAAEPMASLTRAELVRFLAPMIAVHLR